MDNILCMFLHITLVTSLSTVDLTPNFTESNYIFTPTTRGASYVAIALTVTLFWESLSRLLIKIHVIPLSSPWQSSVAYKMP